MPLLVPLILDHNLRNTRQIAVAFQPLVDHPMRFLGGDGPEVLFEPPGVRAGKRVDGISDILTWFRSRTPPDG